MPSDQGSKPACLLLTEDHSEQSLWTVVFPSAEGLILPQGQDCLGTKTEDKERRAQWWQESPEIARPTLAYSWHMAGAP